MSRDGLLGDACAHDVQPVPGDEDWGRCVRCDEDGFPLTDRAAYGDVACGACKDTGLVPVCLDGQVGTRKDGSTFIHQGTFADARCTAPRCRAGERDHGD